MTALKNYFDEKLAKILADKIIPVYPQFNSQSFITQAKIQVQHKELKARVATIADLLHTHLIQDFKKNIAILMQIVGPENKEETGMFSKFYWLMPVAYYVEKYGLNCFDESINAIQQITKRNTGEYAVRPFIERYPKQMLRFHLKWSKSKNVHLRRLASEGLRPKLPWAKKLDIFELSQVQPILENLKEDPSQFVQKSVANNLNDYLKIQPQDTFALIRDWNKSQNLNTKWIIKHALRKELQKQNPQALKLMQE